MRETQVWSLGQEDPLEKEMATHSSTLAWKIPWTEEPCRLQSMGSQRVRHDWATSLTHSLQSFNQCATVYSFFTTPASRALQHQPPGRSSDRCSMKSLYSWVLHPSYALKKKKKERKPTEERVQHKTMSLLCCNVWDYRFIGDLKKKNPPHLSPFSNPVPCTTIGSVTNTVFSAPWPPPPHSKDKNIHRWIHSVCYLRAKEFLRKPGSHIIACSVKRKEDTQELSAVKTGRRKKCSKVTGSSNALAFLK